MTAEELEQFSVGLFKLIFQQKGYKVWPPILCPQYVEEPIFHLQKEGEEEFIVKLLTTMYPEKIEGDVSEELLVDLRDMMETYKAPGRILAQGFACVDTDDFSVPINGGGFFVTSSEINVV